VRKAYFIGVDLHKAIVQVCVLDADGEVVIEKRFTGGSVEDGLAAVKLVKRYPKARVAVEAVGFNRWFVDALIAEKRDVLVVDPVKMNLRASGKKTDRDDAYEIARRLRLGDLDRNAKTYYPTNVELGRRRLTRTKHDLVKERQRIVNMLRAFLAAHRIPFDVRTPYNAKGLKALDERVRRLAEIDHNLGHTFSVLARLLENVQAAIVELEDRIKTEAKAAEVAPLVETIPSVGPQTALTIVSELGDVSRFRDARAAASFAGVVPRVANSADKSHHGRITKRGNSELRWVLNEWAVRLLAFNEVAKKWAAPRLKKAHRNKVRTALARRLIVGVYVTLRRGEVFSLERCLKAA
jgi:transposase